MLRITIHKDEETTRLALEGRLIGDWVGELERCWRQWLVASSLPIRVELADVSFIDDGGLGLLARMAADGVELVAADVVMKAVVEEIRAGMHQA